MTLLGEIHVWVSANVQPQQQPQQQQQRQRQRQRQRPQQQQQQQHGTRNKQSLRPRPSSGFLPYARNLDWGPVRCCAPPSCN